jgi:hypothetical protein
MPVQSNGVPAPPESLGQKNFAAPPHTPDYLINENIPLEDRVAKEPPVDPRLDSVVEPDPQPADTHVSHNKRGRR